MLKSFTQVSSSFRYKLCRKFGDVVPTTGANAPLGDFAQTTLKFHKDEIEAANKVGADLFLTPEKLSSIKSLGLFYEDLNPTTNPEERAHSGWKYSYLKNMLLYQNYNSLFREYLQSCCTMDHNGLNLMCEERLRDHTFSNLNSMKAKFGYHLEMESLRMFNDYKILRTEVYKNLNVNRSKNKSFSNYIFTKYPTPFGPAVVATEKSADQSFALTPYPYILATTVLIQTPMKIAVFNQNLKKKIHGHEKTDVISYVVRFESQFNFNDFLWMFPTQNKPNRLRRTVITDFNNVLRGNPLFLEKFDLVDDKLRYSYMPEDQEADRKIIKLFTPDSVSV